MIKKVILIFILLLPLTICSQIKLNDVGVQTGIGQIEGKSPSISSYSAKVFFDISTWLNYDINFRFAFYYAGKLSSILPDNDENKYYPFQKGFSLQAVIQQEMNEFIFFEEGAGILTINDRFFSDTNEWAYGTLFSLLAGLDFRSYEKKGIKLGLGYENGITFTKTAPSYKSLHIQTQYYF